MKIKIYGSRASMPFFNKDNLRTGGNTSCIRVDMNGHVIILDCGTGIAQFHLDMCKELQGQKMTFDILIGHLHIDHIIGLSMFPPILNKNNDIRIYTKSRSELPLCSQVFGIFKPPYWPIDYAEHTKSKLIEINDKDTFSLNEHITVTPFKSNHSNDTTAFRIDGEKTLIYLLDYEYDEKNIDKFVEYCKNSDVIIFDSTYFPEHYFEKRGWGHSTYEMGIKLAEMSGCKKMIFSHLSQDYSDEELELVTTKIDNINEKYFLAFDGMELRL